MNRRHHIVVTIRSDTHLEKTLYIDVAGNSRTRILVTVVNLGALVVSEIDSI